MGYYVRVLGTSNPNIHIDELIAKLSTEGLTAEFGIDQTETPENWTAIGVTNSNGDDLIDIERNPVIDGDLGKKELDEFRIEVKNYRPTSAAKWLDRFFDKVKVIYAFRLLDAATDDGNFPIVNSVRATIWNKTGGILQADNEGFSNENGYHILWQFSDSVRGEWSCAVKNFWGQWTNFKMDLGDINQREDFFKGNLPKGATKL